MDERLLNDTILARWYSGVFKFALFIIGLDFILCVIWLPIGVSKTYGFRTAKEAFLTTCKLLIIRFDYFC